MIARVALIVPKFLHEWIKQVDKGAPVPRATQSGAIPDSKSTAMLGKRSSVAVLLPMATNLAPLHRIALEPSMISGWSNNRRFLRI
jgi:hypothetical protein